ncbi:MAG: zinc ribbon domain-containing protein [Candidatus Korarchaeum sp.]
MYELKRGRLQSKVSKKPSLKRVLAKYSRRERNRAKDFVHKLTTFLSREYRGYVHGFEDLRKEGMFKRARKHNRKVVKSDWRTIQSLMSYKSRVMFLNPKDTSRRCSRCGMVNAPKGAFIFECGLRRDRQLNAALNLYLQMEGISRDNHGKDQFLGGILLIASIMIVLAYGYLLFFYSETIAMLVLELTGFIAVLVVFGVLAWIGYALAATLTPKTVDGEVEEELKEKLKEEKMSGEVK